MRKALIDGGFEEVFYQVCYDRDMSVKMADTLRDLMTEYPYEERYKEYHKKMIGFYSSWLFLIKGWID